MYQSLNILLVPNPARDIHFAVTLSVAETLRRYGAILRSTESVPGIPRTTSSYGAEWADIAVVFGGDGSILRFAREAARNQLPILGVNCGNLGYMAELNGQDPLALTRLFTGEYQTEERMMLSASVLREGEVLFQADCLNDAVVSYGQLPHLVSFELSERDQPFATYNADGIVFATPTGSTAYSLSAGGPVVDPEMKAIVVTPVCAHSLTSRPMVFSENARLSLRMLVQKKGEAYLTVDGDHNFRLCLGDRIVVVQSSLTTRLIRFSHIPFGTVLAAKLNNN